MRELTVMLFDQADSLAGDRGIFSTDQSVALQDIIQMIKEAVDSEVNDA